MSDASRHELTVVAPGGVPEVRPGDDLAGLLLALVDVVDGDVVVVTSKVVSKAEGRVRPGSRDDALAGETQRVVARRGPTTIVRTHHGLTMAAAGIDASNVEAGTVVLLPVDPDASARAVRAAVRERTGRNVGVIVTDTAGRAWREGQTDIAIGAAGLLVAEVFEGRVDGHGNTLAVTAPAVADEIAGMAELAQGKLGGRPFALVRGRADLVLPPGDDGPGARALVRAEGADLFGYGAREAVVRALAGLAEDRAPFGAAAGADELVAALATVGLLGVVGDGDALVVRAPAEAAAVIAALAFAHGWQVSPAGPGSPDTADSSAGVRLRPVTP
ncbi:MAG: putative F420-dependent oxidoreductase [Nocardioides sp.]|jgi:coenzyme F420-0:L-glutamate ligase/coenzyme F420-1:gamma-L-glutamate ligase|nr:putative F420-dependent oxidoreductase [Nocardioides sp.]